ncbi:lipid-A-disaccharide synthase [Rhodoferax sp. TBRC 17660]|uniref:Lipid-A-disaccharide synthase n=1 Tax=Rhodoferax potami TaxID=3068338 RepID=A0ABU3KSH8_9BURK|nr:lipid-A-disaccharide synthase [Rhodoferax sp. TBRC 17660]MDT7520172.1 lipid-A-disaccharide synthase [Rhodoferax sp. TBRC 17660]
MARSTSPGSEPSLALVAGEASGDLLAGLLLAGMRARWPGATSGGIGGPQMAKQGFDAWWPHHKLAVHGFSWELLRRYREIVGIRAALGDRLLADKPDVFIGVDAPDFNLALEARLKQHGVKTVHFVCPSIWAWRPERVEKLRQSTDHVLCIFPFEPALLASHGIASTYVGHPLANVIPMEPDKAAARHALGLQPEDEVVAILPGSRQSEIRHLALRFFKAAALMLNARAAIKFIVPAVPGLLPEITAIAERSGIGSRLQLLTGQSHTALAACDVTLIASGTATLEAALFKRPMVIGYHMSWLSWQIMRRKRLQPWVGLPNILCRDFVVPELLQDDATPAALAQATLQWLDAARSEPAKIAALQSTFRTLHTDLRRDTATLATDAIEKVLQS